MDKGPMIPEDDHEARRKHFYSFIMDLEKAISQLSSVVPLTDKVTELAYGFYLQPKNSVSSPENRRYYYALNNYSATCPLEAREHELEWTKSELISYVLYDWGPFLYEIVL